MTTSVATPASPTIPADLSLTRLHLMRAGYLLMGIGLALVVLVVLSPFASANFQSIPIL